MNETEPKLCPLKMPRLAEVTICYNAEEPRENIEYAKQIISDAIGKCDGLRCAWWSAERSCCGVVAWNKGG